MELDDFKKAWLDEPAEPTEKLNLEGIKKSFAAKNAGLRRSLFFECAVVVLLLAGLAWLWFFGSIYRGQTAKMLILGSVVFSFSTFWRLFRAFRGLDELDFSKNVAENLRSALAAAEREIRIYKWSAWAFFGLMAVVVGFDRWFSGMNWGVKSLVFALLLFSILTTGPYLRWIYGQKIEAMRRQLDAFSGDEK